MYRLLKVPEDIILISLSITAIVYGISDFISPWIDCRIYVITVHLSAHAAFSIVAVAVDVITETLLALKRYITMY